ncbi:MAG: ABC transporter permease [Prochlorococcus sp.]|tara:strand:+ start:1086 stop:1850 length:765 start_codon:yes stop_codon:yes gene_type:complete
MWRRYQSLLPALAYGAWLRIKEKFARTLIGSGWIALSALLTMAVLGSIYGTITGVEDWSAYWIYVAIGLVSWNTLASCITASCTLFERARERVLNQPMPLGVFVIEEWVSISLSMLIALFAVLLVMGLTQPELWWYFLNAGWLGMVNLLLGCLWLSLFISPLAVTLADLQQLTPILLQIGFLASPILFYRQSLGALAWVTRLNPLYAWVRMARDPFLGHPHWGWQWIALIVQLGLAMFLLWRIDRRRMSVIRWL